MTGFSTREEGNQIDEQAVVRRIRFLMETQHVLVQDLAYDLGVQRAYLLEVLDERTKPTSGFLRSVASHFKVTVDFLESGKTLSLPKVLPKHQGKRRRGRDRRRKNRGGLAMSDLAVRHQALVECLVDKGVISAGEYNAWVERVMKRNE